MKTLFFTALFTMLVSLSFAQSANVTWGDEFKLKKGSTDLEVIHTDNTGVYVKESHFALKSYFVIGATVRESATLTKLDKDLKEEYSNNFNKELKGKEYESFFFLKDKLFLLATDYSKKDKTLTLFAAEINKASGELAGEFTEVTSWQKDEKSEDISFKASYNSDSTKMVLVSTVEGREKNNYEVRQFDDKMKAVDKPIAISNEFDPKTFVLEDVVYTSNGNVVMVGREYEYQEGKKKKAKYLDFKNYVIRIYNNQGKQLKEINTAINAKWLVSTKVMQLPVKELVLAAFYSDEKRGREINGMLVQRINPATGEIITTSQKDINTSMITTVEDDNGDDDDDESRKERKEREKLEKIQNDEDGFSKYMRFRNFIYTADNGLVILAEKYNSYSYTTTSYSTSGGTGLSMGRTTSTTYQVYECGDIMMSKIDAAGNIGWLNIVPKQQREVIQTSSSSGPANGISMSFNFFRGGFNWPFYAGYGVLPANNSLNIIFNDNKKNDKVLQLGQKVKKISYFGKSDCFAISLNPITGKYTRASLFNNKEVPTAMPRLSSVLGKDLYMIGKEDRMLGKTKIAIARLSIK
ncbi:hypothetical protein [Ferruginibacter sp. SUN106]|uniref:hypothetical protein n=1 Tax=Ferruginibacter sp. SUN106 TaxID=2978348 RepID=UPI003D35B954